MAAKGKAARREPDPPARLAQLAASLEKGGLARGYVLRGEERYFHQRALALLRARADAAGHEVRVHDPKLGGEFTLSGLIDDLSGGGLFASARLVVVRNPEELLRKADSGPAPLTRAIAAFCASAEDPGCVVLSGSSLRADNAAVKAIVAAGGEVLTLRRLWDGPPPWNPDPREAELVKWVQARGRELGVTLDAAQAVYVCAATGNDLAALDDGLGLLRGSGGGSVREIVPWDASTQPWAVADHLLLGDLPRGLAGVETLFRGGFLERGGRRTVDAAALTMVLLGALNRGVRQSLAASRALASGMPEADAARSASLSGPPAAVKGGLRRAQSRPPDEWLRMLEDVADLEREAKSGAGADASSFARLALRWRRRAAVGRR